MDRDRLGDLLLPAGALVGLVGAALALGATVGVLPRLGLAHVAGMLLLPAGLVVAAAAITLAGDREAADALLVFGGFWLHLVALALAVVAAAWWLVGGGGPGVALAALAWGIAAAVYATLGYLWDKATPTDVDAVHEAWRSE